ncbi:PDZ domain-containing protein [Proteiniclasticum sp. C24MP]|uniref:PDZ domain-containing protein n=1 Tax=Proteiniclasticum sp. C24MP TaxID=3374101 RepID=UPI0037540225
MEILNGYFSIFASPQILIMLILLIVFYMKNTKEANVRRIVLGDSEDSPLVLTLYQMISGIAGGFVISIIAGVFNIAFYSYMEVQIIFLLTVFSVTRFSGYVNSGINVMAVFLAGYLLNQEVIPVLDLVNLYLFMGLIYMVHGLMLLLSRKHGFMPVLFSRNGIIRGGFKVEKTYLLPAAVGFYTASGSILGSSVFYLTLFHLFHVQETVMTFSKKQAVFLLSGLKMLAGSLILMGSIIVSYSMESVYLLIILVPLLIYLEKMAFRLIESRRKPFFTSDEDRIMILEVRENTPAYRSGLRSGDRILSLNEAEDPSYKALIAFMGTLHYERDVNLMVRDEHEQEKAVKFTIDKETSTGIIIVPPSDQLTLPDRENA